MIDRPILFSAPMVRALLAGAKTQTRRVMSRQPSDDTTVHVERFHQTVVDRHGDEQPGLEVFGAWWHDGESGLKCPHGEPGDRLWVRESWSPDPPADGTWAYTPWAGCRGGRIAGVPERFRHPAFCNYAADWLHGPIRWTPSIHMPRWASRIMLEITGVRAERLQAISEADALTEGVKAKPFPGPWWQGYRRMADGELMHQQHIGAKPPDWMVEPHPMRSTKHLDQSAADGFRALWASIHSLESWEANPWVWVIEFERSTA